MKQLLILVQLALAMMPSIADARYDGEYLLKQCTIAYDFLIKGGETNDPTKAFASGYCIGLVNGVMHTNYMFEDTGSLAKTICLPDRSMTELETVRIVVKYLQNNPTKHKYVAASSVMVALQKAYPCPKK